MLLAVLGIALSIYLWSIQVQEPADLIVPCTTNGGCYDVLTGAYGKLWGIPMAVFGVFYYVFVLFTAFLREKIDDTLLFKFLVLEVVWGILFSLYLRFLEFYYIGDICSWCWLSVLIVLLLAGLVSYEKQKSTAK